MNNFLKSFLHNSIDVVCNNILYRYFYTLDHVYSKDYNCTHYNYEDYNENTNRTFPTVDNYLYRVGIRTLISIKMLKKYTSVSKRLLNPMLLAKVKFKATSSLRKT